MKENEFVQSYLTWFRKRTENLTKSKGVVGKQLLSRFQCLGDDVKTFLEVHNHADTFRSVVDSLREEKPSLRWLHKLAAECDSWSTAGRVFSINVGQEVGGVVEALVDGTVDLDEAIELVR